MTDENHLGQVIQIPFISIPASAIAMVGDNGHDLEMAHAAGAGLAVGVLSGNSTLDDLASLSDAILGSIADLPDFLAGRAKALRT